MSGTLSNVYNNLGFALTLHAEAMARLQEQAATGSRINRVSDDPSVANRVLGLNSQQRLLENYMGTISDTIDTLNSSSDILGGSGDKGGVISIIQKTGELLAGITGTDGGAGQVANIEGIKSYLEEMLSFANWEYNGRYLFGGSDTDSAPYDVTRDSNGNITNVTYQGSLENKNIEVAPGVQSSAFYIGDNIFHSNDRGDPEFVLDNTGVAAGTGTSSVTGYTWLNVTYNDVSGHYELYIDDESNPVDIDPAEDITNLAVTNLAGKILYVNAEGIDSTGVELVSVPGTHDIFNALITIRDIIENENNFSSEQLGTMQDNACGAMEELNELSLQTSTSIWAKIGFLDNLKDSLENIKFNTEDETTSLQEADIAQIAIDLSRREVLYQMSLAVAGKLMSMSLMDFI